MAKKQTKRKSRKAASARFWQMIWQRFLDQSLTGKVLWVAGISLGALLTGVFALYLLVSAGVFGVLPSREELAQMRTSEASSLYSADGELLGRYFVQNRINARFEEIPPHIVNALVATEDERFFEHEGIDPLSILRVVFRSLLLGDRSGGGGSTISQQLAKNLYGRTDHAMLTVPVNKLRENILALKLEDIYTKEEIVLLYLNTVPFGENVYGIKAAAERFFGKTPAELTVPEAAVLVGMLKAGTTYNPRLNPEKSRERRNVVLRQMEKNGYLTGDEFTQLAATKLELNYQPNSGRYALAPYLQNHLRPELETLLEKINNEKGTAHNLQTDGLKIYTTVLAPLQRAAEQAVESQMKSVQKAFEGHWGKSNPWGRNDEFVRKEMRKTNRYARLKAAGKSEQEIEAVFKSEADVLFYIPGGQELRKSTPWDSIVYHQRILQASFVALHNRTGAVLAYVGGLDHVFFPYDHVYAKRQCGSTFKPIVYAAALESGADPCDMLPAAADSFPEYNNYRPQNSNGRYDGYYSMRGALTESVNTVAVRLLMNTGFEPVTDLARRLGLSSRLPRVPSLALGVADASLMEMVRAYTAFGNGGRVCGKPTIITKIETAQGEVIYQAPEQGSRQVLDKEVAEAMRLMMESAVNFGTGSRLRTTYGYQGDAAGKTGTTQNNADGWFIAALPKATVGAWVGGANPAVRFRSTALGQGAATALPIVGKVLNSAQRNRPVQRELGYSFAAADDEVLATLDCPPFVDSKLDNILFDIFGGDADAMWGGSENESSANDSAPNGESRLRKPPREEKKTLLQRIFGKKN